MVVCSCRRVSDRRIRAEVRKGATAPEHVADRCGAGTGCGGCVPLIQELIGAPAAPSATAVRLAS